MKRLPGVVLWCAFGKSPLMPEIDALLASDAELAARVRLLGHVRHPEMETLYRACDGFVSASRREGSGYALIEALACGCRTIVTDIPSFRTLTGEGAAGTLVTDDPDAMADAILLEFSEPRDLGEARRVEVRDHFDRNLSFDAVGAKLVRAYADLAAA
jgi:glycosyltransferase involved in cell wall biosynthesis